MYKFWNWVVSAFVHPSAEIVAERHLEDAQRGYLMAAQAEEYAANLKRYHGTTIKRLGTFLGRNVDSYKL